MSAATLPLPLSLTLPLAPSGRASAPWQPSEKDRLIFKWVKFDGHTQSWVADQLGIHQTTVSRIVERYERWIARGGLTSANGMTREERLRYQRWMTYERNEIIIAACLRLAAEMERGYDTSKSNILRHAAEPSRDLEVRTEHKVIDRSGNACRFLRLAHRIGQEQLKLVEQDDLEPLPPLTIDDCDPALDEALAQAFATPSRDRDMEDVGLAVPTSPKTRSVSKETSFPGACPNSNSFPGSCLGTHDPEAPASSEPVARPSHPAPANRGDQHPLSASVANNPSEPIAAPQELLLSVTSPPSGHAIQSIELTPASTPVHKMHNAKPETPAPTPCNSRPYTENQPATNFSHSPLPS